jgi:Holliday junction resolvase
MGGRSSKRKGSRVELELVKMHLAEGIPASKVPLSGAAGGEWSGDIHLCGKRMIAEVKSRKNGDGFSVMEGWLEGNDVLILKRDRSEPFVALNWSTYITLMRAFRDAD